MFGSGSDGAASSYHVKQLEEQNGRLKEALVRYVGNPVVFFAFGACYTLSLMADGVSGAFQDARPVCIREAGTREAAEADGEEEHRAGFSEEPKRKTAGRDDSCREDHR